MAGGGKKCFFCKTSKKSGISILKGFICFDCEKEIAGLSQNDPRYSIYVQDIKGFWKALAG